MTMTRSSGFTLVEVMITVVILAILVGIAYPSYQNYTRQARRSDAQVGLTQVANRLEKFFTYCNSYPASASSLTAPWPGNSLTLPCPRDLVANPVNDVGLELPNAMSPDGHYLIGMAAGSISGTCSGAAANVNCGYTLTANPNGAGTTGRQRNDGSFRLDSQGTKQWDKNNSGTYEASENSWK